MSKINAFRIINLSYNNNGIRIDDEIFQLNGDSTLLSLRNGGGKSVLVQMLTAPFVHKRFRDVKERPFASYFSTNKPTFLLIEWILDGGVGCVLTGMMVRKRQAQKDEETEKEELEIINFISEYTTSSEADLYHIPVITENPDGKVLRGFNACANLFESWKSDKTKKFFVYDMSVFNQSKNYFNKLEEYQIYSKEWESIIKKVNLKESGLSELFQDAKDEKGLVDKWFLDAVESKLNKEESRMKEFEKILQKFIIQYKENKTKIEKKEIIQSFKEDTLVMKESALDFDNSIKQKKEIENRIANIIEQIKELNLSLINEKAVCDERIALLKEEIDEIRYDEFSYDIYQLKDQKNENDTKQMAIKDQIEALQVEKASLERKKQILECSKIYEEYREESKEVQYLESERELVNKEEKDLSFERKQLGYSLRCHYEKEEVSQKGYVKTLEDSMSVNRNKVKELKEQISKREDEQKEVIASLGALTEKIKSYNHTENTFNEKYKESITRNILGEYEPGILEIKLKEEEISLQNKKKELIHLKKQKEEKKQEAYSLTRQLEDNRTTLGALKSQIINLTELMADYEKQLSVRKTIIKHIGFTEEQVFQYNSILQEFDTKISKINEDLRGLKNQEDKLRDEHKRLEGGKVLELPKEFEEALQREGINITFGMEWLKRNEKSVIENKEIVAANPFIPYGLIIGEQDLIRLMSKKFDIFTSFPIPIIKREALIKHAKAENSYIDLNEKVNFYVLFNDNLLDEKELKKLLEMKQLKINNVILEISNREAEREFYIQRVDILKSQTLTSEKYQSCRKDIDTTKRRENESNELEHSLRTKIQGMEELRVKTEEKITKDTEKNRILEEKVLELKKLMEEYDSYHKNKKEEGKLSKSIQKLDEVIRLKKDLIDGMEKEYLDTQTARLEGLTGLKEIQNRLKQFIIYGVCELLDRDIEDMEARYLAITKDISLKEKNIEEQLEKAKNRFEKKEKDLIRYERQYNLVKADYDQIKYDDFIADELEKEIKIKEREIYKINQEILVLSREEASITVRISEKLEQMQEKLGREQLKSREQIKAMNFKKSIAEKKHQRDKLLEQQEDIRSKQGFYEENLSILSEYSDLVVKEVVIEKETLLAMDKESMKQFIATLRKNYRSKENEIGEKKQNLDKLMLEISAFDRFQDDYFRKPLITLNSLTNEPSDFITQLGVTIEAYDLQLEKLEVDIAIIDKEKEKILEMLLGYVEEVHNHLGKIDKNSTIKVRDRMIKMLRIIMPDWKEQSLTYHIRLRDYIEELTTSGMLRLEKNENIEELIGTQITTKKLYDTVVGIGNIEIKLYKIEEQREYPITWAEVAKNSGGEGFLSAFVVLSSLLSFMRRDDTDIFSEREQGKVLVMDNPFAQTNAAHLLKPLMDTAKKNNTQLICLSGLGGDSIYNRFDNIYILSLVASGLNREKEYLKSEHIKGEDTVQSLISALVKTEEMEQLELLF